MPTIDTGQPGLTPQSMLGMASTILNIRQEKKAQAEQDARKAALVKLMQAKTGDTTLTYPDIEAQMTMLQFQNEQQNLSQNETQTAQTKTIDDLLKPIGGIAGFKAIQMLSEATTAKQRVTGLPAEEQAARAQAMQAHTAVSSMLDEIGGPEYKLAQQLGGPATSVGRLVGMVLPKNPAAEILQNALNLTPDPQELSQLPLAAAKEHHARLSQAITEAHSVLAEGRAIQAETAAKSPASYQVASLDSAVKIAKDKLDLAQRRQVTLEGKSFRTAADEDALSSAKQDVQTYTTQMTTAMQALDQAKQNLVTQHYQGTNSVTNTLPAGTSPPPGATATVPTPATTPASPQIPASAKLQAVMKARAGLPKTATDAEVAQKAWELLMGGNK